jgi:hypothetical protein
MLCAEDGKHLLLTSQTVRAFLAGMLENSEHGLACRNTSELVNAPAAGSPASSALPEVAGVTGDRPKGCACTKTKMCRTTQWRSDRHSKQRKPSAWVTSQTVISKVCSLPLLSHFPTHLVSHSLKACLQRLQGGTLNHDTAISQAAENLGKQRGPGGDGHAVHSHQLW